MHATAIHQRKFFNIQDLAGKLFTIQSNPGYSKQRLNFHFKKLIGLLAHNQTFSTAPYTGVGLETYFYCNYNDVCE
jgi:hypothetical protein